MLVNRAIGFGLTIALTACSAPVATSAITPTPSATSTTPPSIDAAPSTDATKSALLALSPAVYPSSPTDISNKYSDNPAAAAFGQQLFFDSGFSGALIDPDNDEKTGTLGSVGDTGRVACAGCHVPGAAFSDNRSLGKQISLAAGWGHRRAPSLLDVGQAKLLMWDGRRDALYNQPIGAIENGTEMNSSRLYAAEQIYKRYRSTYEAIFGSIPIALDDASQFPQLDGSTTGCRQLSSNAYGIQTGVNCHGVPGDGAEFDHLNSDSDRTEVTRVVVNMGKAIAAYERLLKCGAGRFDQWMHGDASAMSASEQRGAALFVGHRSDGSTFTSCNSCHSGPFMTDQKFHNTGLVPAGVGSTATLIDADDHGVLDGIAGAIADPLNVRGMFSDGDDGRLPTSVDPSMDGAFRTPSLRCVSKRPSFLHNGQLLSLTSVVTFFDRGGDVGGSFPGSDELTPLNFTTGDRADLVAFLQTLDGLGPPAALLTSP